VKYLGDLTLSEGVDVILKLVPRLLYQEMRTFNSVNQVVCSYFCHG
jgi:hypothetical protein